MTVATYFSGFGLKTVGAIQAGYSPVLSVEYNPDRRIGPVDAIASVYADNLGDKHLRCEPAQDVPESVLRSLEGVDLFMASPPCIRASVANAQGGETDLDGELAEAVCRAIRLMRPKAFILENVYGYREFAAFERITDALTGLGYGWDFWHVNSADYGVPQTRRRLILMAFRGGKPILPKPTHDERPHRFSLSLFDAPLLPWDGWYGAVEDLLPDCPECELANWQDKRMVARYGADWMARWAEGALLLGAGGFAGTVIQAGPEDPSFALTANNNQSNQLRAVLVNGTADDHGRAVAVPNGDSPATTVHGQAGSRHAIRAVLVTEQYRQSNSAEERFPQAFAPGEPSPTVMSGHKGVYRAILCPPNGECYQPREATEPSGSVAANHSAAKYRAVIPGVRIVSLTPRCLARFQTIPDWYKLPAKKSLACTGIGNGVPVELARVLAQAAKEQTP